MNQERGHGQTWRVTPVLLCRISLRYLSWGSESVSTQMHHVDLRYTKEELLLIFDQATQEDGPFTSGPIPGPLQQPATTRRPSVPCTSTGWRSVLTGLRPTKASTSRICSTNWPSSRTRRLARPNMASTDGNCRSRCAPALYCSAPFETRAEPSSLDPPVAAIHCYGF
jgi:hypothetical protein